MQETLSNIIKGALKLNELKGTKRFAVAESLQPDLEAYFSVALQNANRELCKQLAISGCSNEMLEENTATTCIIGGENGKDLRLFSDVVITVICDGELVTPKSE